MATARPFVVDPVYSAIAIGYRNPDVNLIADRILPRVPVASKFSWLSYDLGDRFTVPTTKVGRKGRPNQVEFSSTEIVDEVDDYYLDDGVPNRDITEAEEQRARGLSGYDPMATATEALTDLILLDREIRVAGLIFNLNTYAADKRITLSGTSQFSDFVNSDPIGVINAAADATLVFRPNVMVIGRQAWTRLRSHPHVVNACRGNSTGRGNVTRQEVADLFELAEVVVGDSVLNTAKRGQSATIARAWGKHIALLYVNRQAGPQTGVTFGFTAQNGTRTQKMFEDPNMGGEGGQMVRVGERLKEIIAAKDVGYFIQNAVA
jgi:hypothetical protein